MALTIDLQLLFHIQTKTFLKVFSFTITFLQDKEKKKKNNLITNNMLFSVSVFSEGRYRIFPTQNR